MTLDPQQGIHVRALRKSFRSEGGTHEVLKGLDLDLLPGEVVGLVGPNGNLLVTTPGDRVEQRVASMKLPEKAAPEEHRRGEGEPEGGTDEGAQDEDGQQIAENRADDEIASAVGASIP